MCSGLTLYKESLKNNETKFSINQILRDETEQKINKKGSKIKKNSNQKNEHRI